MTSDAAEHVYAVVRIDRPAGSLEQIFDDPNVFVTVREVVPTPDEAIREVARLNDLNAEKDCVYFAQATRYFPHGRQSE